MKNWDFREEETKKVLVLLEDKQGKKGYARELDIENIEHIWKAKNFREEEKG